jgi:protein TonB
LPCRSVVAVVALCAGAGCEKPAPPPEQAVNTPAQPADQEPPVALNADSPIQYPPKLFDRRVEGDVVLRLFIDSTGKVIPESSRVGESSGYPALDSAALAGAKKLRYAPARRRGASVATAFLQRIEFRHPEGNVLQGSPDAPAR